MLPPRILFYNYVKRHWKNWRLRRMWRDDPERPRICPQAGAITQETLDWAAREIDKITGVDGKLPNDPNAKPFSQFRAEVMARRENRQR